MSAVGQTDYRFRPLRIEVIARPVAGSPDWYRITLHNAGKELIGYRIGIDNTIATCIKVANEWECDYFILGDA